MSAALFYHLSSRTPLKLSIIMRSVSASDSDPHVDAAHRRDVVPMRRKTNNVIFDSFI